MSEPEPNPTPGPAPYELPNDKSQAVNKKKLALRYVLDTVEKAVRELEADFFCFFCYNGNVKNQ